MKTGNPIFNEKRFQSRAMAITSQEPMTVNGTINKTGLLFFILTIGAAWTWSEADWNAAWELSGKTLFGLFAGLALGLITAFKPQIARYTSPVYAFCEGLFLGGLSAYFEARYAGIVIPAVLLTFAIMAGMLAIYRAHIIPITRKFRMAIVAATAGVAFFYLAGWLLGMFGVSYPILMQGGGLGIGINLFIIAIASMNLLLDFDFIEQAVEHGYPKEMEWYAGFGLMVTMVWLYIEVLRLFRRIRQ